MFRSQRIIIREYVCTSLKLLNYLKNTEFKILKIIPGVVAAKRVAGIRGDPCGAGCCSILQTGHITLSSTPDQLLEKPQHEIPQAATTV